MAYICMGVRGAGSISLASCVTKRGVRAAMTAKDQWSSSGAINVQCRQTELRLKSSNVRAAWLYLVLATAVGALVLFPLYHHVDLPCFFHVEHARASFPHSESPRLGQSSQLHESGQGVVDSGQEPCLVLAGHICTTIGTLGHPQGAGCNEQFGE